MLDEVLRRGINADGLIYNSITGGRFHTGLLGLSGTVSEDAVRTAMYRIEETADLDWLSTQILVRRQP